MWRVVWVLPLVLGGCSRRAVEASADAPATPAGESPAASHHGPGASEQAVLVELRLGPGDREALEALEGRLREALARAGLGELDGDELSASGTEGTMYAYGADADRLFEVMRPLLEGEPFLRGATVTLRYGIWHEGMRESRVTLGAQRD